MSSSCMVYYFVLTIWKQHSYIEASTLEKKNAFNPMQHLNQMKPCVSSSVKAGLSM